MRVHRPADPDYANALASLNRRFQPTLGQEQSVAGILAEVRERGDAALLDFNSRFDGVTFSRPEDLRVSVADLAAAADQVPEEDRAAIAASRDNVTAFARQSLRRDWSSRNAQGAEVGERFLPLERVGIYVPGGSAPLVSTANMTVALAAAAGVPEIVVCTPPQKDGGINPSLLYALHAAGATEVYKVGGAQAIAAMGLGTDTLAPVQKIYGPGNSWVVEAKRQMFGLVGIDLLPGPSEVVVLSDATGRPDWIAADLLAQAEHGGDSIMGLITDSEALLSGVMAEIDRQAATLSRQQQLQKVIAAGCWFVLVPSMTEGVALVNAFAPEHVLLVAAEEQAMVDAVRTAGAIFVGNHSPVAVGDFLAGPSHELPTGGAGKAFPGLTVDQFQRRTSIVRLDADAIKASAPLVAAFARMEGLDAHGRSATIRVDHP